MSEPAVDDWDPRDPSVLEDQRRAYDEMRERCPVAHSEFMGWSIFRHADVAQVTDDPATYTSATRRLAVPNGMDPPVHGPYREALAPAFGDDRIAALEHACRQIEVRVGARQRGGQDHEVHQRGAAGHLGSVEHPDERAGVEAAALRRL